MANDDAIKVAKLVRKGSSLLVFYSTPEAHFADTGRDSAFYHRLRIADSRRVLEKYMYNFGYFIGTNHSKISV